MSLSEQMITCPRVDCPMQGVPHQHTKTENERINEQLRAELETCRNELIEAKRLYTEEVGMSYKSRAERAEQQLEECRRELAEVKDIARQTEDNAHNWRVAAEMKHPGVYDVERLYHHLHCDHCSKAEQTIAAQKAVIIALRDNTICPSCGAVSHKCASGDGCDFVKGHVDWAKLSELNAGGSQ